MTFSSGKRAIKVSQKCIHDINLTVPLKITLLNIRKGLAKMTFPSHLQTLNDSPSKCFISSNVYICGVYQTQFMTEISFCCRYSLIETIDGKYGAKDKSTGEWNGMVGMIVRRVGSTSFY